MNTYIILLVTFLSFILYWSKFQNRKLQNLILFIFISCVYFWIDPFYIIIINVIIISNYYINNYFNKDVNNKTLFYFSIFINVVFFILLKLYVFNQLFFSFKKVYLLSVLLLPIGCIIYILGLNKNRKIFESNYLRYFNYIIFYPLYLLDNSKKKCCLQDKIKEKRDFSRILIVDGFRQILWGSFKVFVIAINSEIYANQIFNSYESRSSLDLVLGIVFYIFQVYGYLSGYFDLINGFTKLFGFSFKRVSNYSIILSPIYCLNDLSLYLIEKLNKYKQSINFLNKNKLDYFFIFLGLYFLGSLLSKSVINLLLFSGLNTIIIYLLNMIKYKSLSFKLLNFGLNILVVFFNCILIRSTSFNFFISFLMKIFSINVSFVTLLTKSALATLILIFLFCIIEWIGRKNTYALERLFLQYSFLLRWGFYSFIIMLIFLFN